MEWSLIRRRTFFIWGWIGGMIAAACAPNTALVTPDVKAPPQIRDLRVVSKPLKTEVFVVGESPMTYTTFYLTDPDRFVVDILEVGLGAFTQEISVPEGPIRMIRPKGTDEGRVARLEMGILANAQAQVKQDGATLVVEAVLPPPVEKPVSPASMEAEVEKPIKPKRPPATMISDIHFERTEPLQLVVVGNGEFSPTPFFLDIKRLVIDFPNVQLATEVEAVLANHRSVKQVRVGKHPDKVRLVIDLLAPVEYSLTQNVEELRVTLKDTTSEKVKEKVKLDMARQELLPEPVLPPPVIEPVVTMPVLPPPNTGVPPVAPSPVASETQASIPSKTPVRATEVVVKQLPPDDLKQPLPTPRYVGRKISLDFQDADISDIIRLIAEVSRLNIVLSDDVKGKMTLKLVNVPWDQALDVILQMNSLGQDRDGDIIIISTLSAITQRQEQQVRAKETGMAAEDRRTEIFVLNYSTADAIKEPIRKMLSPRGDVTVDTRTNTLIIKDIEENLKDALRMAKRLDVRTPQVSIEARIVQALPKFNRSLGVQWGGRYKSIADSNLIQLGGASLSSGGAAPVVGALSPGFAVNLPSNLANFGGLGFTFGRFTDTPTVLDLRLSAGESQGLTRIISTPKVTVLDNQPAKIQQGESIPFSTVSQQGTQTTFVDANIILDVTPHISADGGIVMKINISKNAPGEVRPGASGPSILKKEASTNVLVLDGETIVIGGIHETTEIESVSGIPLLSQIPIVGWFFKNKDRRKEDSELLVFLTPRLVQYAK